MTHIIDFNTVNIAFYIDIKQNNFMYSLQIIGNICNDN